MVKKLMLAVLLCAAAVVNAGQALPELSFFIGVVELMAPGADEWEAAMFGQELEPATQVKTYAESRAELSFADGSVVRVGENSLYTLSGKDAGGKDKGAFLSVGKVWSNIQKMSKSRGEFQINSPTAIAAVRGTVYGMEMGGDSTATVKVYEGEVEVSNPPPPPAKKEKKTGFGFGGATQTMGPQRIAPPREVSMAQWVEVIKAQQQIVIGRDGKKKVSEFDLQKDGKDSWVAFNRERDKSVDRSGKKTGKVKPGKADMKKESPQKAPVDDRKGNPEKVSEKNDTSQKPAVVPADSSATVPAVKDTAVIVPEQNKPVK